ncbi:P4 alpha zinc-binding domain protein [Methylobacterium sp. Leaf92]|nr:P4 alpha zinc-binding domain protein [Methylobacterium sp. Leaf92]
MLVPLRDRARGRWASLLPMIGVDSRFLDGRKNGPCPMCGGKTRFRFDDKEGRGTWICNHCGAGDGPDLAMRVLRIDFRELAEQLEPLIGDAPVRIVPDERSPEECRASMNRLWSEARLIQPDDPVARYLTARLGLTTFPRCLRTVERLRYQDDYPSYHPAMVAKVSGPDGEAATLHRTYLSHDGRKAAVEVPRRLMRGKVPDGAAIRLFPPAERLGIAEGIETALAAARLFNIPVWAATNSTMLAKWQPPDGAREIVVFGDADAAFGGQAAAYALAHRLAVRDRTVRVELPPRVGSDWADVLEAERSAKRARRLEIVA